MVWREHLGNSVTDGQLSRSPGVEGRDGQADNNKTVIMKI